MSINGFKYKFHPFQNRLKKRRSVRKRQNACCFAFSRSIQGVSHVKTGKVCQDFSLHFQSSKLKIAIVSDGHGGASYCRSDRGSRLAADAMFECIQTFCEDVRTNGLQELQQENECLRQKRSDELLVQLEKSFVARWRSKVEEDWNQNPLTEVELESVPEKSAEQFKQGNRVEKAYGATILAVAITPEFWFAMQLGDGSCVAVRKNRSAWFPVPEDDSCTEEGTQTSSLCEESPILKFRHYWGVGGFPEAIYVSTDGIENCYPLFEKKSRLGKLYCAITEEFHEVGFESGLRSLEEYMFSDLSRSGDDISIAGIVQSFSRK